MKKILLFALTAIAAIVVFIISCSKQENSIEKKILATSKSGAIPNVPYCGPGYHWDATLGKCVADNCQTGYHWDNFKNACVVNTIYVITNPNNPDDSAGNRHNGGVSSIMPNVSSSTAKSQVINLTFNYLVSYGYDTSALRVGYNFSDSLGIFGYSAVDSLAYKMYAKGEISSTAENYMLDLASLLNNVIGDNDPIDSIYDVFANDAINYENGISADNSLSSNEKIMLLSAYSVARYSAAWWGNYLNNYSGGSSSAHYSKAQLLSFFKKFWKKIVGADAAGAGGGAAGAYINDAFRGTKYVNPGQAAVSGGVIGSVVEAIKDLFTSI